MGSDSDSSGGGIWAIVIIILVVIAIIAAIFLFGIIGALYGSGISLKNYFKAFSNNVKLERPTIA